MTIISNDSDGDIEALQSQFDVKGQNFKQEKNRILESVSSLPYLD